MADDFNSIRKQLGQGSNDAMNVLGYTPQGQANLQNVMARPQQMVFAPIDAAQRGKPAYSIAKSILDAAAGHTTVTGGDLAGNVQDTFDIHNPVALAGLAGAGAAADVFADPAQSILAKAAAAGHIPLSGQVKQYGKGMVSHGVPAEKGVAIGMNRLPATALEGRATGIIKTDPLKSAWEKIARARAEGTKLSTAPGTSGADAQAVQDILNGNINFAFPK